MTTNEESSRDSTRSLRPTGRRTFRETWCSSRCPACRWTPLLGGSRKTPSLRLSREGTKTFNFVPLAARRDEWKEMVDVCRTSFALSRHLIPDHVKTLDDVIEHRSREELEEASRAIFSDAVKTVAAIWVRSWMRYVE